MASVSATNSATVSDCNLFIASTFDCIPPSSSRFRTGKVLATIPLSDTSNHSRISYIDRRGQRFMKDGFEEAAAVSVGDGELRVELVAKGYEFIDLGGDTLLFGEGRERDQYLAQT